MATVTVDNREYTQVTLPISGEVCLIRRMLKGKELRRLMKIQEDFELYPIYVYKVGGVIEPPIELFEDLYQDDLEVIMQAINSQYIDEEDAKKK